MHVTGIITEYNPFHKGHQYQIAQIHKKHPDAAILAVMSGSIVQRGQPALLNKWLRAELAVRGGCDLVLELPFAFACRSAQDFARGGVALLSRLGIVDTLAFGAETADLDALQGAAAAIDLPALQAALHERIAGGESYATALSAALLAKHTAVQAEMLRQPNNILAIEYLRALRQYASSIRPLLILRTGAGYHDTDITAPKASASAVRALLEKAAASVRNADGRTLIAALSDKDCLALKNALPSASWQAICQLSADNLPNPDRLLLPLQTLLLRSSLPELQSIYGISEGLENRIANFAAKASNTRQLIQSAATKRYPASRIARTLIWLLLGVHRELIARMDEAGPLYARVLAASLRGRSLLHDIKKAGTIPLIAKTGSFLTTAQRTQGMNTLSTFQQQLALDTLATELRQLAVPAAGVALNDFQQSPLFISSS